MRGGCFMYAPLRGRGRSVVLVTMVLGLVAGGVAFAAIPDSGTGVISACYSQSKGTFRPIDAEAGETCKSSETLIEWNKQGPAGATGATGPTGATGATGPAVVTGATGTGIGGSCSTNHAIQSVNGDGSVNCVAFVPAGAVLASGPVVLNLGDSQTLLDAGGISITGTCTAAGRAQIAIAPTGGAYIDLSADSTSSGHYGGGTLFSPGSLTLADTSSAVQDRGSFNAASSNFFELDGTFLAWTNDVQCVVSASGIAASSPIGASAKSALSANGEPLPESK